MDGKTILERVRRVLDDEVGEPTDQYWSDAEILDDYTNDVEEDLCQLCRGLITDSSTASDPDGLPLCRLSIYANTKDAVTAATTINVNATAGTFTRLTGSFITDGFIAGNEFTGSGFANAGNNSSFIISTVTALVITVVSSSGMVTETGSGDEKLTLSAYTTTYSLSPYILEIQRVKLVSLTTPTKKTTYGALDISQSDWEKSYPGTVQNWLNDMDKDKITLYPPTDTSDTVRFTVRRLPLTRVTEDDLTISPEINRQYHKALIPGILSHCFKKGDEETYKPNLADKYEKDFYVWVERIKRDLITVKDQGELTMPTLDAFR